jgi:hypothetical protein
VNTALVNVFQSGEDMAKEGTVNCEFLVNNQFCKSTTENEEGKAARERDCLQAVKNMCCYLCSQQESCEISCVYLDHREKTLTHESAGCLTGMILASQIISNPAIIEEIQSRYLIIYDQTLVGVRFDNLNRAINVMAEKGWRCVSITSFNAAGQMLSQAFYMYALMERL